MLILRIVEKSQAISAPDRTVRQPLRNVGRRKPLQQEDLLADRIGNEGAAAERARWLAELAFAVDRAQRLARTLSASQSDPAEAIELGKRLEAIRTEVEELRRGSRILLRREIDPRWTGLVPWNRRKPD